MESENSDLKTIYAEAVYAVFTADKKIKFRAGENSQKVNALLDEYQAAAFAFLTAYNPFSKVLPDKENEARQKKLIKILKAENFKYLEGYGTNETESWKREKSLFIFNISKQKALKLAREFEQNAILYGEKDKPISLVWCQ